MRSLRTIAIVVLACVGLVVAAGVVLWGGSLAGLARADVVTTGAMEPNYAAGDLVIATTTPASGISPGDIVSVRTIGADAAHLAQVVSATQTDAEAWTVVTAMPTTGVTTEHSIGAEMWAPSLRIPVVGGIVSTMLEPAYLVPAIAVLLLLGAVVLVGRAPAAPVRRTV